MIIATPVAQPAAAVAAAPATGAAEREVGVGRNAIRVFTYRPGGCRITGLLVVFHGLDRNANSYRDHAKPLADRLCLVVAAPLFDERRFPTWRYQRGGVADRGSVQPSGEWTVGLVAPLVATLRRDEGTNALPYYLIGHSAGAQFLSRVAAYTLDDGARTVIANPSTYVLPSLDVAAPYGFGRLPDGERLLRAYLARPVTLLLGEEDVGEKNLAESDEAVRQGPTRIERGRRTFAAARALAMAKGWTFGWRLLEVPGVGHSARSMFSSEQAIEALKPETVIP